MKKQLIDMMIEDGVKWLKGAEYAAQDKNSNDLCFYRSKPRQNSLYSEEWRPSELDHPNGIVGLRVTLPSLCAKWRSTLVTREQYEKVMAERRPALFPTRPPETFMCRCVAAPVSRTIEQRIASLRALEKQVEETRAELTRDLESLGLTWMVRDDELSIKEHSPKPGKFNNARIGSPTKFDSVHSDEICDSCGKRFGQHVGVSCRP